MRRTCDKAVRCTTDAREQGAHVLPGPERQRSLPSTQEKTTRMKRSREQARPQRTPAQRGCPRTPGKARAQLGCSRGQGSQGRARPPGGTEAGRGQSPRGEPQDTGPGRLGTRRLAQGKEGGGLDPKAPPWGRGHGRLRPRRGQTPRWDLGSWLHPDACAPGTRVPYARSRRRRGARARGTGATGRERRGTGASSPGKASLPVAPCPGPRGAVRGTVPGGIGAWM